MTRLKNKGYDHEDSLKVRFPREEVTLAGWCLKGRGCEGSGVGEGSGALAWAAGEIVGQPQRQVFGER